MLDPVGPFSRVAEVEIDGYSAAPETSADCDACVQAMACKTVF